MESSTAFNTVATILIVDFAFAMLTGMTGIHGLLVDGGASLGQTLGIEPLFEHAHHTAHAGDLGHAFHDAAHATDFGLEFNGGGGHDHYHYDFTDTEGAAEYMSTSTETGAHDHATHHHTGEDSTVTEATDEAVSTASQHSGACYDASSGVINLDNGLVYNVEKGVFLKNGSFMMGQEAFMSHAMSAHPEFSEILDSLSSRAPEGLSPQLVCP